MSEMKAFKNLALAATKRPWDWQIEDYSMISLHGADGEVDHVLSHGPCKSCLSSAAPQEWKFGRCTTINEPNATFLTLAANYVERLVEEMLTTAMEAHECRAHWHERFADCDNPICVRRKALLAEIEEAAKGNL